MNKNIIVELTRAREIMGLNYKNYNILSEQVGPLVDDFVKVFLRRKVAPEVAQTLANRVEKLFAKTTTGKIGTIFERLALKEGNQNIHTTAKGFKKIVSSGDKKYPLASLDYILHKVSTGKLGGDELVTMVNKLPKYLKDGIAFRSIVLKEMQELEQVIIKETIEKQSKKLTPTVRVVDDIIIPEDLPRAGFLKSMWNFTKSIFYNPLVKSFGPTRQSSIRRFLQAHNVNTPDDLVKFLTRLQSQAPIAGSSRFTPDEITRFVVAAIERGEPIPPKVVDDMMGIFLRSTEGFPPSAKPFSDYLTSAKLRNVAKNNDGLSEVQLRMLIGDNNFSKKILLSLNEILQTPTLGGFLRSILPGKHWIPKSTIGKVLLWGSFTLSSVYTLLLNLTIELKGTKKAIAGLTQQLYQKFSGQKEVVFDRGGLSDDEAKAIAKKLHGYLKSVSVVRDAAQLPEFAAKVESYPHKDVKIEYGTENIGTEDEPKYEIISKKAESIEDIPNAYRKEFLEWFQNTTRSSEEWFTWEAGKFIKTVTGVDDDNITDVIKMVPTVLAMSQVTWFYNHIDDGKLMRDLGLMVNILPYIGNAWNKYGKTKQDVFDLVEEKEWLIGSRAAGDDLADVVKQLKAFWPIYPIKLRNEAKEWVYCRYKQGAYINTDNLNRIAQVYPWDPIGDEENNFDPKDFQEFLNGLTAEEFNAGQCYDQGDACPKPYFTTNPEHPDVNKKAGEKIETIVVAFENMVDEMYKAWDEGGWDGLQEYVKTLFKSDEGGGRNPSPNIQEGLIRVLKQL